MPQLSLAPPLVKSITRPNPSAIGAEWTQVDSSGLVIEKWTWNGSLYMSERKLHSLPVDDINYVSGGKFWSIGKEQSYGLYLLDLFWTPVLTTGTYNATNYWSLALSEYSTTNDSPVYSTELRTANISPTAYVNVSLSKSLNRTVDSGCLKIRLTTYKSGIPPAISHGWIGLSYRLSTP